MILDNDKLIDVEDGKFAIYYLSTAQIDLLKIVADNQIHSVKELYILTDYDNVKEGIRDLNRKLENKLTFEQTNNKVVLKTKIKIKEV